MKRRAREITFILALAALLGCERVILKETIIKEPLVEEPKEYELQGGVDSGGGNGVNGRPFESYRLQSAVDLGGGVVDEVYSVIKAVEGVHPALASDLAYIFVNRDWYLIPVRLAKIPRATLGVLIDVPQQDQIALQNLQEVWIDSHIYGGMNASDQVALVLHELVVGVRLLEYTEGVDRCLAQLGGYYLKSRDQFDFFRPTQSAEYESHRSECFRKNRIDQIFDSIVGRKQKVDLKSDDYKMIRKLSGLLVDREKAYSFSELDYYYEGSLRRQDSESKPVDAKTASRF
ncbi:MAG: hypothetical protein H6626_01170 [Pseudobdellovibrionaceae bacterium]|nr:hypothetical protein [Bdellovibrionales bacterium]USN47734.1 MAG: hypothetical protein H6626_01170 [Pseudobdellovibrionaceae bacterium]